MRWAGHVPDKISVHRVLCGNPMVTNYMDELGIDERILFKYILNK